MKADLYESLRWRCIGPHRGGRVVAVAGDPDNLATFYFGSTGGGVWKTTDGGLVWRNVSDGYFQLRVRRSAASRDLRSKRHLCGYGRSDDPG